MDWETSIDSATTNVFGLRWFKFSWLDALGNEVTTLSGNGNLSRSVISGNQYTVGIGNNSNISGPLGTRTAQIDASFEWSLDTKPVPEPASIFLVSLGLLGLIATKESENLSTVFYRATVSTSPHYLSRAV